jgi:hypothetical protein
VNGSGKPQAIFGSANREIHREIVDFVCSLGHWSAKYTPQINALRLNSLFDGNREFSEDNREVFNAEQGKGVR